MIFVTGDIHQTIDIKKLTSKEWPYQKELTKNDYLIILGDFGMVWDPEESSTEKYWLQWLEDKPFTTLFLGGNHENWNRLATYPIVDNWNGGRVQFIRPSVIHLMMGEIYTLENKKILCLEGAYSHDISDGVFDKTNPEDLAKLEYIRKRELEGEMFMYRILNESYWIDEVPNQLKRDYTIQQLEKNNWTVDFVISHEAPASSKVLAGYWEKPDEYSQWLEKDVRSKLDYKCWYCGHLHTDYIINPNNIILYDSIFQIN